MNPIVAIAARLAGGTISEATFQAELQQLSDSGVLNSESLHEALGAVLHARPATAVPLVVATVDLVHAFLLCTGTRQSLGSVLFAAAHHLGERVDDPRIGVLALTTAADWYAACRPHFDKGDKRLGTSLVNEAIARTRLAGVCVEPVVNYGKAITLYAQAYLCFSATSPEAGRCLMSEADIWEALAAVGVEPLVNYGKAIALYAQAAPCFPAASPDAGHCLMREAITWHCLAAVDVKPLADYGKAIALYAQAVPCFPAASPDAGSCLMNEAITWSCLADVGFNPVGSYRNALALYAQAAPCFPATSPAAGNCLMNEAVTWSCLAAVSVDPAGNYRKAIELYQQAMWNFIPDSLDRAKMADNFARAWRGLAGCMRNYQEKHQHLCQALTLLREEAMPTLERIGSTFGNEVGRRSFRETFGRVYRRMISVCLELAALETNPEQAEALRWEAWQWVQRSKARTMQESMAAFAAAAQEHDPAQPEEFKKLMLEQAELDRRSPPELPGSRSAAAEPAAATDVQARLFDFIAQLLHHADARPIEVKTAAKEPLAVALARIARQDRPIIVVEFFSADEGRIGAFIHPAGSTTGLAEPVWLAGRQSMAAGLVESCLAASSILRRDPRYRARDSSTGAARALSLPSPEEIVAAKQQMDGIAADLGALLAPVREFIYQQQWTDATLLLCPTGHLHLLPLAAAHWGEDAQGRPLPLIAAHTLLHLPTAALAVEVINREHPVAAERSAYIAAADPWGKLTGIYREADDAKVQLEAKGFTVTKVEQTAALADTLHQHGPGVDVVHLAMHSAMSESRFELCGAEFHDRRLAVLELMRWLRFQKAQLAIIATCSSGQAMDLDADDPSAITRAWMLAGAPSVIGGLWPLGDEAAYQFSTKFYEHWTSGMPLADAVRQAMLHVRDEYANDIYSWAPFILVGNGATVI